MISYSSSTGTIIGGTSATSSDSLRGITHLPSGADYAIYVDDTTVSNLNPNNTPGTYSFTNVVAGPVYTVPTATGTLEFTALSSAQQLSNAQSAQIAQLKAGLNQTLIGNFKSNTTGHTYVTTEFGEANMHSDLTRFSLDNTITSVQFYTVDAGWLAHTQAQLQSAFLDGGKWKDAQYAHYNDLVNQVNAATNVSAVQAIAWTPATY